MSAPPRGRLETAVAVGCGTRVERGMHTIEKARMAQHVAILYKRYIDLILAGRKTVESRLTKGLIEPYGRIEPGDRIWFKVTSGPFMATAIADAVAFHEGL